VNRGMAAQLLARLRGDKAGPRGPLLHDVAIPVLAMLDHAVAVVRWAAMVGSEPRRTADAYAEYPHFTAKVAYVARHYSPALLRAALAAGIANDNPGAAVALALLAAHGADVATAYPELAAEFRQLPAIPVGQLAQVGPVARLVELGAAPEGAMIDEERLGELLDRVADQPAVDHGGDPEPEAG